MKVMVEFVGIARVVSGVRQVSLDLDDDTTFRQIVHMLGMQFPPLIGMVIHSDGESLHASNMLNLNGKRMIQPSQMDESPGDGDRLTLMSILAGG
jgi:hypothetical protein